jgi:pimeloyl-ACP methyl ester carboxylesterase
MKVTFTTLILLISALSLFGQHCLQGRYGHSTIFDEDQISIQTGVVYAEKIHWLTGQSVSLAMDIYAPETAFDELTSRPVVLLFHGGSFMAGNRQAMHFDCMQYARRGYVAVTVSYRLGWNCPSDAGVFFCGVCGPQQSNLRKAVYASVQDALDALNFLAASANDFGIDVQNTFIGGESAGAMVAIHAAVWSQEEADSFSADAAGIVGPLLGGSLPGAYPGQIRGIINNCGAVVNVNHLAPELLPVVSFHDEGDCVVPYGAGYALGCLNCTSFPIVQGSQSIYNYMNTQQVCTELNTMLLSLGHCQWPKANLVRRASCFMKRTMCGVCTTSANIDNAAFSPCDALGIENNQGPCSECPTDLNHDGIVNFADLVVMLASFGSICP